jgi:hypothetical protein
LISHVDNTTANKVLEAVAALGPVRLDNTKLIERLAEVLGLRVDELRRTLAAAEESGILVRRGDSVRITPDVLADFLLLRAAVAAAQPTGFAKHIFDNFAEFAPQSILENLAELDWQARQSSKAIDLFADIWGGIEQEFTSIGNAGRRTILEIMRRVAFYQPARVLRLVEIALSTDAPDGRDDDSGYIFSVDKAALIRALPRLLEAIAYHPDHRHRALQLLWQLGCDDARTLNANPDHPVRLLAELAGYDVGRLEMADAILNAVNQWLDVDGFNRHAHSLLDVIDPILEKAGSRTIPEAGKISFEPFFVNPEATKPVRDKALAIVDRFVQESWSCAS